VAELLEVCLALREPTVPPGPSASALTLQPTNRRDAIRRFSRFEGVDPIVAHGLRR
jgi:hypothetical protein